MVWQISRTFHPWQKLYPLNNFFPSPQALAITTLLSVSRSLTTSDTSGKWNHALFVLLSVMSSRFITLYLMTGLPSFLNRFCSQYSNISSASSWQRVYFLGGRETSLTYERYSPRLMPEFDLPWSTRQALSGFCKVPGSYSRDVTDTWEKVTNNYYNNNNSNETEQQ